MNNKNLLDEASILYSSDDFSSDDEDSKSIKPMELEEGECEAVETIAGPIKPRLISIVHRFSRWAIIHKKDKRILKKFPTAKEVALYLNIPTQKVYDYSVGRVNFDLSNPELKLVRLKSKKVKEGLDVFYY